MRFKARLQPARTGALSKLASTLAKTDRAAVLHLTPPDDDRLELIVAPGAVEAVGVWSALDKALWFENYRIESQNRNHIALELDLYNLIRALRSAASAEEVVVRLAKKGVPVLTFEIRSHLGNIVQDVPVNVLSAGRLLEYREPATETDARGVVVTPGRVCAAVEKMRAFARGAGAGSGAEAVVELEMEIHRPSAAAAAATTAVRPPPGRSDVGSLRVGVFSDTVEVRASYTRLKIASMDGGSGGGGEHHHHHRDNHQGNAETTEPGEDERALRDGGTIKRTAAVDVRHFSRALQAHAVVPKHAFCFLLESCVLVHFPGSDMELSCYLPLKEW